MDAVFVLLVNIRTELAQGLKMEINGTVANTAASQRGDECFTEPVQERPGKKDGDPRGAG